MIFIFRHWHLRVPVERQLVSPWTKATRGIVPVHLFDCYVNELRSYSPFSFSFFLYRAVSQSSEKRPALVRSIKDVRPKGAAHVAALEWRIKEDMLVNMLAVMKAAHMAGAGPREEPELKSREAGRPEAPSSCYEQPPTRAAPPPQPPLPTPLQQFNDQSTQLLKQTIKVFLPTTVYLTARQAINAINTITQSMTPTPSP